MIHDRDPVAEELRLIHIVGGKHDGAAGRPKLLERDEDVDARLRGDAKRRLIKKEHVQLLQKGVRQRKHTQNTL